MNPTEAGDILSSLIVIIIIGSVLTAIVRGVMLLFSHNKEWVKSHTHIIAIICFIIALLVRISNS